MPRKKAAPKPKPIKGRVKCPYCSAITGFMSTGDKQDVTCGMCSKIFLANPIPEFHRPFNRK